MAVRCLKLGKTPEVDYIPSEIKHGDERNHQSNNSSMQKDLVAKKWPNKKVDSSIVNNAAKGRKIQTVWKL